MKIVVAGGGFGGVRAALDLSKRLPKSNIILISDNPYHTYHADLYKVATAVMRHSRKLDFKKLESSVNIPLSKIFKNKNVEYVNDTVVGFDFGKKNVKAKKDSYSYDYLVIALGSETNYFNVAGAWEYSHPFKNLYDALNVRDDLCEIVGKLGEHKTHSSCSVVIAGGGFTGVELAGSLHNILRKRGQVSIIEGENCLLSGLPVWMQKKAYARLNRLGVKVKLDTMIGRVSADQIITSKNEKIPYDYLIWTTGVKGVQVRSDWKGVDLNKKGQIMVKSDLSLEKYPEVFCIGDLANIKLSTAYMAIAEGKVVAENIVRLVRAQAKISFKSKKPYFIVPIGDYWAISNLFNLHLVGFLPWRIRSYISFRYLMSILPKFSTIILWWKLVNI